MVSYFEGNSTLVLTPCHYFQAQFFAFKEGPALFAAAKEFFLNALSFVF